MNISRSLFKMVTSVLVKKILADHVVSKNFKDSKLALCCETLHALCIVHCMHDGVISKTMQCDPHTLLTV